MPLVKSLTDRVEENDAQPVTWALTYDLMGMVPIIFALTYLLGKTQFKNPVKLSDSRNHPPPPIVTC